MSVIDKTNSEKTLENSSRRNFLKNLGIASGGLVVGIPLTACASTNFPNEMDGDLQPNALLQITSNNDVIFYMPRSEMGQGVYTGLTTILAEELDVHPSKIKVENVGAHKEYANPEFGLQGTGGSNSIRVHFVPLRQMAANVRMVIRQAAAQVLQVSIDQIQMYFHL